MRSEEPLEARAEVAQTLDVGEVARPLDCEDEAGRRLLDPIRYCVAARQAVEGRVHLDGVEAVRVELEPARRR
jgi:hypothetical protein